MENNSLTVSDSFVNSSRPLSTVALPDDSYVLSIAALPFHYAVAASAPSNAIHLLDRSEPRAITRSLPGHAEGVSYLRASRPLQGTRDVLLSCGKDGTVKAWDERTGSVGVQMGNAGRTVPLLCCDATPDGSLVAAGTILQGEDALILYWDPRNAAAPLRQHSSMHSDDITAVHFSQHGSSTVLLSASTDGLLCTSNPHEADEDEANINIANWGCSISKAGWLPRNVNTSNPNPRIWAASDMETLSFWSNELSRIEEINRDRLTQPDPAPRVSDYIIDCHNSRNGSFHVFAGSNEGDIALISPANNVGGHWSLEQLYTRGHSEVVRCTLWDESAGLLLTGGEDAKLNVWSSPVHFAENNVQSKRMDVDVDSHYRKRVRTV